MNTRGLTELIVLNLALEKGVISDTLFAMLVIMALVTTFMAGPLLKLLDPKNEYGEAGGRRARAGARRCRAPSSRSCRCRRSRSCVAPQTEGATAALRASPSRWRSPTRRAS